jgi:hypothetical protein
MPTFTHADRLHRLVKQALDSGEAVSIAEAEKIFRSYRLSFAIGEFEAVQPAHQAALLTGVALARRTFLGGVSVTGALDVPLAVPLPLGATLADAVQQLGGRRCSPEINVPTVFIGGEPQPRNNKFQIRTTFAGWRGGIVPAYTEGMLPDDGAIPLAAILAAALAVNEAFLCIREKVQAAGHRICGLSLWCPDSRTDWLGNGTDEPALRFLPSRLWLIGIGHLGQAYLWGLGLLPYPKTDTLELVLQDIDVITPSNESTSILTDTNLVGQKKTRAMAAWADRRGFVTAIHERLFDASLKRQDREPSVALCGLDNAVGRQALDRVGFDFIVDVGLGHGYRNFRTMRLHTLPGSRSAFDIWKETPLTEDVTECAAYLKMLNERELDRCGITLLAGKSVGAPFVGALAATLAISEILRLLHGGPLYQLIDLDLQSIDYRTTILQTRDFSSLNPGYVCADFSSVSKDHPSKGARNGPHR